ncbi:AAA family ATPase [Roseibium sp.]|uniref:AAA family ATPase n=1 Tax=Roseibium sp. TaxID=1936156 RepID=UPI003BAFD009
MNEYQLVKAMLLHVSRGLAEEAPLAKALKDWCLDNLVWLDLGIRKRDAKNWGNLQKVLQGWRLPEAPAPYVMEIADTLTELLGLDTENSTLLALLIGCDRLPKLQSLSEAVTAKGVDLPVLLAELCGVSPHEALRFVRRSPVFRLGLIGFEVCRSGAVAVDIKWTLEKLLDRAPSQGDEFVDALIGPRHQTSLSLQDFAEVPDVSFLASLITGAVREGAKGVNILVHGPPGTGKTELARVLCAAAELRLHAVGEVDDDGEEPTRYDRVSALLLAQRVLKDKKEAVLLFDEMEDFIGDAQLSPGDFMMRRDGSKVFINRMLENNPVPVIWTTNAVGNMDDAILRRMSYVLRMDYPTRKARRRIAETICKDEQVAFSQDIAALVESAEETTTILRNAARASKLAGQDGNVEQAATALVKTLRGGVLPNNNAQGIDLDLFNTEPSLSTVLDGIASCGHSDVSLLLSGPPGTGKTAFAHHFAERLDKPLLTKRASDLLSKWVGGTERNIADAFADARYEQGVLFFDEADSLMFDRGTAQASWEAGQVNELLSWLDRHDQPVLAATNFAAKLDAATLRRFDFKLELKPLERTGLAYAFRKFFGSEAPEEVLCLRNLTPGDFAVVKKQLRFTADPSVRDIASALVREARLKPETGMAIGFLGS